MPTDRQTDRQTERQTDRQRDRQTDRQEHLKKLIVDFRNFANSPKKLKSCFKILNATAL